MANDRIRAVEGYLRSEFLGSTIEVVDDAEGRRSGTFFFHVDDGPNDYRLEVSVEFLEDRDPDAIVKELGKRQTSDYLQTNPMNVVVLMGATCCPWVPRSSRSWQISTPRCRRGAPRRPSVG